MDGAEANSKYATILCLNVPQGTEFGIDKNCWTVGPKFKGIKLIPPGLHFVFYWYVSVNSCNNQHRYLLIRKSFVSKFSLPLLCLCLSLACSATNKYGGSSAPRMGFFIYLQPGEVLFNNNKKKKNNNNNKKNNRCQGFRLTHPPFRYLFGSGTLMKRTFSIN